ncbi:hypothetical protein V6N13_024114 [Hibiscus sabdariffa]|uniref:Uncharacterized protein n=1 Tax=Hibiscus sabdariffa TaxID=183260 RepID=A0ABR2BWR5_9ROSI
MRGIHHLLPTNTSPWLSLVEKTQRQCNPTATEDVHLNSQLGHGRVLKIAKGSAGKQLVHGLQYFTLLNEIRQAALHPGFHIWH